MHQLKDSLLLDSYIKAKELNLDAEFIAILRKEIMRRGLFLMENKQNKRSTS
ncbi:sporulation histidine kinase inhibitor Sda [Anaerobacillus alkalidiazotrophicus]|uniref:sporulation histidine kinase inhibitor Sda n=1 Tax=Anaerobacillus alkalidiazotrophicus TaxID=472963 RepID=UPI0011142BF6|nr:sporulation histidine kinase inhibitor Sda [Anaerobacillus alkalidiazotrophicus]